MKLRALIVVAIVCAGLLYAGCTKNSARQDTASALVNAFAAGKWTVTKYSEQGHDETSNFSGYLFKFHQNGRLIVFTAGNEIEGSWVELTANKFVINLGQKDHTNKPLGGLSDDWIITSRSAKKFSLKDDTGTRDELVEFSLQ